ncbi:uncharacterized protein LOC128527578 isoform X3 [Clarias gariepinus]|uniref:uncharacterized protein LOC128527578 isoform X3 n=1 Tax=Clarias gariepinus TaxID=13013 RepID=UPI00234E05CD|nr:uncharacterized protein LOC128527578 isoform X3 [Clarias gariepinus]
MAYHQGLGEIKELKIWTLHNSCLLQGEQEERASSLERVSIIRDFDTFVGGWNNHPLRTEGGLTPEQLWCMGHLQDLDEGESLEELQDPGIDWESAVLQEVSNGTVVVPEIECPLDEQTLQELQRTVNPLEPSQSHGRDLYIRFLHNVSN